jgi:hypothetical protein
MAWEHDGADSQSRFDKSTGQAEQMKEGALRVPPANVSKVAPDLPHLGKQKIPERGIDVNSTEAVQIRARVLHISSL